MLRVAVQNINRPRVTNLRVTEDNSPVKWRIHKLLHLHEIEVSNISRRVYLAFIIDK